MKGMNRLNGRLLRLSAQCESALGDALRQAGNHAREAARRNAPVKTGALRASVQMEEYPLAMRLKADCSYAAAVELGGLYRPARPFLLPACRAADYPARAARALKECIK